MGLVLTTSFYNAGWYLIGSRLVFCFTRSSERGSVFAQRLFLHTPRAGHLLIYAICLTANMILSIHYYMVTLRSRLRWRYWVFAVQSADWVFRVQAACEIGNVLRH
jgi:hypothetical protein